MTPMDYDFIRKFLRDKSGLVLTDDKQYLVESRLIPVARRLGVDSLEGLFAKLRAGADAATMNAVVEAMTTNETSFYRDKTPFVMFREAIMPALIKSRAAQKRIRIWCAAASTGQEPYSLAMELTEMSARLAGWKIEILGTDLSTEVLARAKGGLYNQFEVQRGLPVQLLVKYFAQAGDQWQISADIRKMVNYRVLNLIEDFSSLGKFDVVFCRNVLIYFDAPTKTTIFKRLARVIEPDGFLALGAAETVIGLSQEFVGSNDYRGLYHPAGASAAAAAAPAISTMPLAPPLVKVAAPPLAPKVAPPPPVRVAAPPLAPTVATPLRPLAPAPTGLSAASKPAMTPGLKPVGTTPVPMPAGFAFPKR